MSFTPRVVTLIGDFTVNALLDLAFELFSPLGEKSWVPHWEPELLYPAGVNWARGLVFRTKEEHGDAIWIVSHLDQADHRVEYYRVESSRYVVRVEVKCGAVSASETRVHVTYQFVGLSKEGNDQIATMTEEEYKAKMARWKKWVNASLEDQAR